MTTHYVQNMIEGCPTFAKPIWEILKELKPGGGLKILSPLEYHTEQQRKWWKGVLLPALQKDNGDSVESWETRLKLAVMPDEFQPIIVRVGNAVYTQIPSITKLSKKKMNELIEGSVAKLHEWDFAWVTLPDPELRR